MHRWQLCRQRPSMAVGRRAVTVTVQLSPTNAGNCLRLWLDQHRKRGQYIWCYYLSNLEKKKKIPLGLFERAGTMIATNISVSNSVNRLQLLVLSVEEPQDNPNFVNRETICPGGTVSPAVAFCGTTAGWCKVTRRLRQWSEFHRAKALSCFWFRGEEKCHWLELGLEIKGSSMAVSCGSAK